jgi:uncharacterized membrane protein
MKTVVRTSKYTALILARVINKIMLVYAKNYIWSNFIFVGVVAFILYITGLIGFKSPQNFVISYTIVFTLTTLIFNSKRAKTNREKNIKEIKNDLSEINELIKKL